MKNMIKALVVAAVVACAGAAYGHHFHGPYRHHHSCWGPGGRYFWPGFAGGLVGSMLYRPIPPPPPPVVVTTAPTVVPQQVIVTQPVAVPAQPVVIVR